MLFDEDVAIKVINLDKEDIDVVRLHGLHLGICGLTFGHMALHSRIGAIC